jgi:hypothetical protein
METDSVYMGAYRRDIFAWAGPFDEEMACNEDDEFNYRLRDRGGRITLSPSIRSVYCARSSPRALWRQYFRYGLWKVRVAQKVPRQMRPRHFIPFGFVAALLGGAVASPVLAPAAWLWLTLLVFYAGANVGVSLRIATRTGWRHLRFLPVVFLILHLAYGSGFAVGLFRFAKHWTRARTESISRGFDAGRRSRSASE